VLQPHDGPPEVQDIERHAPVVGPADRRGDRPRPGNRSAGCSADTRRCRSAKSVPCAVAGAAAATASASAASWLTSR